jgi:hypothetical protein
MLAAIRFYGSSGKKLSYDIVFGQLSTDFQSLSLIAIEYSVFLAVAPISCNLDQTLARI